MSDTFGSRLRISPSLTPGREIRALGSEASPRLRVSPNLLRAAGYAAVDAKVAHRPLDLRDVLPGIEGRAQSTEDVLDGWATLVVGADVTAGPWHYSAGKIEEFEEAKVSAGGKFGPGTYLGVGALAGETVDGLKGNGSVQHTVAFRGNILVLDRERVLEVASALKERRHIPPSGLRSSIKTAPLTEYVQGLDFNGTQVDAVMVYMDAKRESAEIAVLPESTDSLRVTGMSGL
jgi:hypothetical protein